MSAAGSARSGSRHLLTNLHQNREYDDKISDILGEINNSPVMGQYYNDVLSFVNWLEKTINVKIVIRGYTHYPHGYDDGNIEPFTEFEYKKLSATRWSYDYVNVLLARLYKLQDEKRGAPLAFGSFTVPHEYNIFGELCNPGMTPEACMILLKKAWNKFEKRVHKRFKKISCVRIWEAHIMGYPHFHAVLYGDFSDKDKEWMKKAWADCIGYPQHWEVALEFSDIETMEHPVAYLMKYLYKTLLESYFEWTAADWVMNALLWRTRTRSFQPSNDIAEIMRPDPKKEQPYNIYTHILAEGIPRKGGGEGADLPVIIAAPKAANESYQVDAKNNPDIAPFIPLKVREDMPNQKPVAERAKEWLKANTDTMTVWKKSKPLTVALPDWSKRKDFRTKTTMRRSPNNATSKTTLQ